MLIDDGPGTGCDWDPINNLPGCGDGWQVFPINDDGTLGEALE